MGGGGSKSATSTSNQSTTSRNEFTPPDWMLPYVQEGVMRSRNLSAAPYSAFPYVPVDTDVYGATQNYRNLMTGETIPASQIQNVPYTSALAPLNQQQLTSVGNISQWANQPSNVLDTATQQLTDTMGGSYLNPQSNPYLAQYVQQAMGDVTRNFQNTVMPQTDAAATRAGAFGGSAHRLLQAENANNLGNILSKTATDIYNPAYESERTRQMQAQLFAPQLDQAYLPHYQAGLAAGDIQRQAAQDYLTEMMQRQQQQVQWPYQATQAGASVYSPYAANWGVQSGQSNTTGTTTQMQSGGGASPFSQILGAGLMGLGTIGSFALPGGGSIGGKMLGGLFGY